MALDLEQRYDRPAGRRGPRVHRQHRLSRRARWPRVGLLNEALGYGYDNDLSYRLGAAGYRLLFCRDARSRHRWREGVVGLPDAAVRIRLRPPGRGGGAPGQRRRRRRVAAGDDEPPGRGRDGGGAACCISMRSRVARRLGRAVRAGRRVCSRCGLAVGARRRRRARVAALRRPGGAGVSRSCTARAISAWVAAMAVWGARRLLRRAAASPAASMTPRRGGRMKVDAGRDR